jgi:HEAT repeat protein
MRHIKQDRQIFAYLPALLAAVVAFLLSSQAVAQRDYRPSSEEEHSTPAVDALKDALRMRLSDSTVGQLEFRNRILQERANSLQGLRELYLALTLPDWGDDISLNRSWGSADRAIYDQVADRFTKIIRDSLNSGRTDEQIAAANFLAEVGAKIGLAAPEPLLLTVGPSPLLIETVELEDAFPHPGLTSSFGPDLANLLKNKNPEVVESAARALGRVNPYPKLAGPALQGLLRSGTVSQRRAAAAALGSMVQVIESGFKGKKAINREVISVGQHVAMAAGHGLADPDVIVRRESASAVQRAGASLSEFISTPRTASALPPAGRPLSEREKEDVQSYRSGMLQEQTDAASLARALSTQGSALASLLKDPDPETRVLAARALGELANAQTRLARQTESIPPLESSPSSPAPPSDAEASLRNALKAALPSLKVALGDSEVRVRLAAVTALEMLDRDAAVAVDALVNALKDRDIFVRWAAARTLGNIDPAVGKVAVPQLAKLLFDPDLDPRLAAASTLEHYGNLAGDAVPDLSRAVGGGDAEIRIAVIRALEAIGPESKSAVSSLAKALDNPDDRVRQAAAEALGRLGPLAQTALPSLRKALDDPSGNVRKAAGAALIDVTRKQ